MTFDQLKTLKPNWDSYGARPIDPRCIEEAQDLFRHTGRLWQIVPCSDGGVQLEIHSEGLDIEITVSPAPSKEPK